MAAWVKRIIFFALFCLVLALQWDHVVWFIWRLFDWDPEAEPNKSQGLLRLVFHLGFFLKFLSSRTQAGLNKWTALWCSMILIILTSQHALSLPASCVLLVAGLTFKVGSHEFSIVLQLGFAKKLETRFKLLTLAAFLLTLFALLTSDGAVVGELQTYFANFKTIVRRGAQGWPAPPVNQTQANATVALPAEDPPLLRSMLTSSGGQHVLMLGDSMDADVRHVVQSLQSQGDFAVTIASGYQEAVSAIAEYNFNAVVAPTGSRSRESLQVGRVTLALKTRYHGQLRPEKRGKLVEEVRGQLAPSWPGGVSDWQILQMVNQAEWEATMSSL
eukprot:TRINITY_DN20409_c0_g2_i3.p1 TRINITY_DN20409_c0_g2~~TRINITY_DN20409_c0_g2_i3.p1  ORF type:complete len:330 (-),score=76.94 TRINITY_DN20409_c0_g2_i3:151-1140(-)